MFMFLVAMLTISTFLLLSTANTRSFVGEGVHYLHFHFMLCEERIEVSPVEVENQAQLKTVTGQIMLLQPGLLARSSW